jgi:glycosyltransferase involved in cell wall biosynthesis
MASARLSDAAAERADSQRARTPTDGSKDGARKKTVRHDVSFVVTHGSSSLDHYSEKLAPHLQVRTVETQAYENGAQLFQARLLSKRTFRSIGGEASLAWRLRREQGPLHFPNHHCGRYGHFCVEPYVITVHDLMRMFDARSEAPLIHCPSIQERLFLRLDAAGIRRAAGVIAVSQTTKRDLIRHLGIPCAGIAVIHEGVDHGLFRSVGERPIDEPYLLYVGSEHPRKNLVTLLRAFALLKRIRRFAGLKLVKVGTAGSNGGDLWRRQTLRAVRELGLDREVIFVGRCEEEKLPAYYSAAELFVLPSLYEGFGLPPLEAMACGCPVVVSNRGALPETAGPGAIIVDPSEASALAHAIETLLGDDIARAELASRGLAHAAKFSWERCAQETLAAYDRFLPKELA